MKKYIITIISVICITGALFAAEDGTANLQFLKLFPDARGAALVGSSIASAEGFTASYWNPAGLALTEKQQIGISYNSWIVGMSYLYGGYAMKLGNGGLGFSLTYLSTASIEETDEKGISLGTFKNNSFAFTGGYGLSLNKSIRIGATLKYAYDTAGDTLINGIMADAGILITATESKYNRIMIGARFGNLGWASDRAPILIAFGGTFDFFIGKILTLSPMISTEIKTDSKSTINLGLQAAVLNSYFLYTGYNYDFGGSDIGGIEGFTLGLGVNIAPVTVDFAWVPMGYFDSVFIASLKLQFGKVQSSEAAPVDNTYESYEGIEPDEGQYHTDEYTD